MIQMDTSNILFICGGAFVGIEKQIQKRMEKKSIGFGAEIKQAAKDKNVGEILKEVMPEDFVKFGLIPELIGRIPVVTSLDNLDEEALIRILKEPKNALLKQYTALFKMDGVKLTVEDEALNEIAHLAVVRKTGARGLRAIMEKTVTDAMYHVPSDSSIVECIITKESVDGKAPMTYVHREDAGNAAVELKAAE
jgi:ATP-dependent Clp protease ATP-binding subunit ClpX